MNQSQVVAVEAFLLCLTTFFIAGLVFVEVRRYRQQGGFSQAKTASLCLAIIGWFFYVVSCSCEFYRVSMVLYYQNPENQLDDIFIPPIGLPLRKVPAGLKSVMIMTWFSTAAIWSIKGAFTAMYFTITKRLPAVLRVAVFVVAAYIIVSYLAVVILYASWCRPYSRHWTVTAYCSEGLDRKVLITYTVLNLSGDLLVTTIPFLLLKTIDVTGTHRMAILFLCSLGFLTITVSATRFALMMHLKEDVMGGLPLGPQVLSQVEVAVAVIASSLPSLRQVFLRCWERRGDFPTNFTTNFTIQRKGGAATTFDSEEQHDLVYVKP